jgi:putative DNA primase/helicase
LPEALHDRAQDNWEPLLAIADLAGGHWPETARKAALLISGAETESLSRGVQLLADIKQALDDRKFLKVSMADLISAVCEDEENDWATYNRGRPITPRQFGRLLGEYGIKSKTISIGGQKPKGFERSQFDEAWSRYLHSPVPPFSPVTQSLRNEINDLRVSDGQSSDQTKTALSNHNSLKSLRSDRVTDEPPLMAVKRGRLCCDGRSVTHRRGSVTWSRHRC